MAEHGTLPSVMETSYEVPHHMGLQQQDGDKTVEQGPSPSTTAMSANLFNNMKTTPQRDSYSKSRYETAHETLSLVSEESDDLPHPTALIFGGVMDEEVEHGTIPSTKAAIGVDHGDICTNISPSPTYEEMLQLPCEESHHPMSEMSDSTICDIECITYERMCDHH